MHGTDAVKKRRKKPRVIQDQRLAAIRMNQLEPRVTPGIFEAKRRSGT
jgi:hypothetical protein